MFLVCVQLVNFDFGYENFCFVLGISKI